MRKDEIGLKDFCEIIKKIEIGTGKPSKMQGKHKIKWREPAGKIAGGSLYFYSSEEINSDHKLTRAELRAREKEVRKLMLSDLIASGAFSPEQLKRRGDSVIDLVVKVHEETFRLLEDDRRREGRAAHISGSIRFHAAPNIRAMLEFGGSS